MSLRDRIVEIVNDTAKPLVDNITTLRNAQSSQSNLGLIQKLNSDGTLRVKRPDGSTVDCNSISTRPLGVGKSVILADNIITD